MKKQLIAIGTAVLLLVVGLSGCTASDEFNADIEARLYLKERFNTDKVETKNTVTLSENTWRVDCRVFWGGMWRAESVVVEKSNGDFKCRMSQYVP